MIREFILWSPLLVLTASALYYFSRPVIPVHTDQVFHDTGPFRDADMDEALEQEGFTHDLENDNPEDYEEFAMGDDDPDNDPVIAETHNDHQHQPRRRNPNRIVGAKKTKSLARKDQLRAYNEYMRQQGEEERRAHREFEEQHAEQIAAEKEQRAASNAEADEKLKSRLEAKRKEYDEQKALQMKIVNGLRKKLSEEGQVLLTTDLERALAPDLGLVVDDGKWLVRLDKSLLDPIAKEISSNGRISFDKLSSTMND